MSAEHENSRTTETYTETVSLRLSESHVKTLNTKCANMGRVRQSVLRELVVAFNEGRVRIVKSDKDQKPKEEMEYINE